MEDALARHQDEKTYGDDIAIEAFVDHTGIPVVVLSDRDAEGFFPKKTNSAPVIIKHTMAGGGHFESCVVPRSYISGFSKQAPGVKCRDKVRQVTRATTKKPKEIVQDGGTKVAPPRKSEQLTRRPSGRRKRSTTKDRRTIRSTPGPNIRPSQ